MARFANSVMFTPAAGGTADFVVSAAVQGFMTPALAGAPTGVYKYRAESADLSQWEIGEGTYTSGTTTLTRTTVLYNSAGTGTAAGQSGAGTKINFTVAPDVGIVQAVQDTLEIDNAGSFTGAQRTQARANIGAPLKGHIFGLTLSMSAPNTVTFSVAAGECADSTGTDLMTLASSYSKTTSAWAVGSGNGALDTGSIVQGWYHMFIIKRPDTGVVDVLFSASATAPTLPANYTLFRRIGSIYYLTTGPTWVHFYQIEDQFFLVTPVLNYNATAYGSAPTPVGLTLSVPTGVVVEALYTFAFTSASASVSATLSNGSSSYTSGAPNPNGSGFINVSGHYWIADHRTFTNTSAAIFLSISVASTFYITTKGWRDMRGRYS